eukprot:364465-Chlamydomonas_euryale.AAC.9
MARQIDESHAARCKDHDMTPHATLRHASNTPRCTINARSDGTRAPRQPACDARDVRHTCPPACPRFKQRPTHLPTGLPPMPAMPDTPACQPARNACDARKDNRECLPAHHSASSGQKSATPAHNICPLRTAPRTSPYRLVPPQTRRALVPSIRQNIAHLCRPHCQSITHPCRPLCQMAMHPCRPPCQVVTHTCRPLCRTATHPCRPPCQVVTHPCRPPCQVATNMCRPPCRMATHPCRPPCRMATHPCRPPCQVATHP